MFCQYVISKLNTWAVTSAEEKAALVLRDWGIRLSCALAESDDLLSMAAFQLIYIVIPIKIKWL